MTIRFYCFIFLFIISCAQNKKLTSPQAESFAQCTARHEEFRKLRFLEIPEKFRTPFSGYHHIVKYYGTTPSIVQMKADVSKLEKENNYFDARSDAASKDMDPRLLDTAPGRNRILISFERHRNYRFGQLSDVTLLRVDYGKPEITYTCPLEAFKEHNPSLICQLKGSFTSAKALEGAPLTFKYDMKMRIVPINDKYFYFEWLSSGDKLDPDQSTDYYFLRSIVFTGAEDRFFKNDHPYLDPAGDLNPETCAELEGR